MKGIWLFVFHLVYDFIVRSYRTIRSGRQDAIDFHSGRVSARAFAPRFLYEMVNYIEFPYSRTASVSSTGAAVAVVAVATATAEEQCYKRDIYSQMEEDGRRASIEWEWTRTRDRPEQEINLCAQFFWDFFLFFFDSVPTWMEHIVEYKLILNNNNTNRPGTNWRRVKQKKNSKQNTISKIVPLPSAEWRMEMKMKKKTNSTERKEKKE